jgi:hypothetical protein
MLSFLYQISKNGRESSVKSKFYKRKIYNKQKFAYLDQDGHDRRRHQRISANRNGSALHCEL